MGRILSSSKLAARPQCLVRLQFLLAFRSLFVVPRCFETRLVSLSHLSEVVSSFISAGGLYRMNPGGAPHSYPCGHVMTSTIHVRGGQKPKKGGHDKLLLHGHSSMPGDCTRFRAKSVPEFQVHLYSKRLFVPAPLKPPTDFLHQANLWTMPIQLQTPPLGMVFCDLRVGRARHEHIDHVVIAEWKRTSLHTVLSPSIILPSFQVSLVVGLLPTYAD
jgi:hypothetical protein